MDDDNALEQIQYYIDIGAIRIAGYNEDGEAVFELNEKTTRELAPELWEAHMHYIDETLISLYKDGLLNVEYDENLEAIMHFTKEGYDIALEKGAIPINPEDFYND